MKNADIENPVHERLASKRPAWVTASAACLPARDARLALFRSCDSEVNRATRRADNAGPVLGDIDATAYFGVSESRNGWIATLLTVDQLSAADILLKDRTNNGVVHTNRAWGASTRA